MPVDDQLRKVADLYTANLTRSGAASTAVGWNSPEGQRLRFAVLAGAFAGDEGPVAVNDYGCGYGAMLRYIEQDVGLQVSEYYGYDISAEMLEATRRENAAYGGVLDLRQSPTIATDADYSFVSGTFNVRFDASNEDWEAFITQTLDEMDRRSRRAFAFNLLSSYVDWEEGHLYYGDPCRWFDHCKRAYSKRVSLIHDYPLWEWTIVVRK